FFNQFCDQTAYSVDKLDQTGEHVLPYGWEIVQDMKYGTFYIDHINKHTHPRGFGFTIIGGSDCNRSAFLQVKHLVPGGPASLNSQLAIGDVIVSVDGTNVLGYTHSQLVSLLQSIPVGASINLLVSQGYRLRRDIGDPSTSVNSAISGNHLGATGVSGLIGISAQISSNNLPLGEESFNNLQLSESHLVNLSRSPGVVSSHSSLSPSSSSNAGTSSQELLVRSPSNTNSGNYVGKLRNSQRPEFLKVSIFKQTNGFGFTLADHIQGQHVKAISDPIRCGRLRVGDVIVEINDQRVKDMPHVDVVQILKQCPVGKEARLLVQRGALPWKYSESSVCKRIGHHHHHASGSTGENSISSSNSSHIRSQTPDPCVDRRLGLDSPNHHCHSRHCQQHSYQNDLSGLICQSNFHQTDYNIQHSNNSNVSIGAMLLGGSAQLSEVVRTGDKLISIDGVRVIGATHAEVVELLDRAAHTVGQVTLGLQRGKVEIDNHCSLEEPVDIVISRSEKSDGFGFFLTNTKPSTTNSLNDYSNVNNNNLKNTEFIAQLVPGSQAERMGLLSVGDQILAVNGIPTCGLHHDEVVRLIRESGNHIALKILPYSGSTSRGRKHPLPMRDSVEFPVTLFRGSRGFGFSIRGGQEFNRMPLVVLRIADGGAAQLDGQLKVGDELVEINGYSTIGMSHGHAIEIIQRGGNTMRLIVRRRSACVKHQQLPNGLTRITDNRINPALS
ncbi:Membrane-associated guanylate kinase, WW and PDZ domain-containing protein 3, partial [Schistosoma japonicum]